MDYSDDSCFTSECSDHMEWGGWFEQDGDRTEMTLDKFKVKKNGKIKGKGEDAVGEFKFKGFAVGKKFMARKHYSGAHTIMYWGDIDSGLETLEGFWGFEMWEEEGPFKLEFA